MPGESPWSSASPLCPDPGRATWEEKEEAARTPFSVPLLSARRRPAWPRQGRPTVLRRRDQTPPARPQGRRARLCPCTSPEHPAPATYWTPLPPPSWPIKSPAEHTNERTPLPASSQIPSLPPVRSRSLQPSTPASYWTRVAPPRWAAAGVPPESFPPLFVKPCFLYARRRRRRLPLCTPVSSFPRHRARRRRAVGLESNGSVPIRVT
jgi:hypothetical protein